MRNRLSDSIVNFIGGLFPLYEHVVLEGNKVAARCLADGTMIFAVEEDEENENGYVLVHWQGDPSRACETRGEMFATIAVARYAELHAVSADKRTRAEYEHLADHFAVKTGGSLVLEREDGDSEAYALVGKLVQRSGTAVAIALLKKALGL